MSVCRGHERREWGDVLTGSSVRQQPVVSASFDRKNEYAHRFFFLNFVWYLAPLF